MIDKVINIQITAFSEYEQKYKNFIRLVDNVTDAFDFAWGEPLKTVYNYFGIDGNSSLSEDLMKNSDCFFNYASNLDTLEFRVYHNEERSPHKEILTDLYNSQQFKDFEIDTKQLFYMTELLESDSKFGYFVTDIEKYKNEKELYRVATLGSRGQVCNKQELMDIMKDEYKDGILKGLRFHSDSFEEVKKYFASGENKNFELFTLIRLEEE